MQTSAWLDGFETMLAHLTAHWDGQLLITRNANVDMLKPDTALTKHNSDIISIYKLHQVVTKPTRIAAKSKTIIDHFITNHANRVTHTNVLPCPLVSDHSALHLCIYHND